MIFYIYQSKNLIPLLVFFWIWNSCQFAWANTNGKVSTLPPLSSKQRPPVGKKAADSYILSTYMTKANQYEKNTKSRGYSIGIYLTHFTISTAYHSPLSPKEQGFSSGLIYLQEFSASSNLFFRGHLSLDKSNNRHWSLSVIPLILYNLSPIYVGAGGPGLNFFLNAPDSNNVFALDWQILAGIRFFEIFNFFNFFIEARWKNPFNIFDTSQRKTIHFLAGVLLLF